MAQALGTDSIFFKRKRRNALLWFPIGWLAGGCVITACLAALFGNYQNAAATGFFTPVWFTIEIAWMVICRVAAARILRINCPICGRSVSIARAPWPLKRNVSCKHCRWKPEGSSDS